MYKCIIIDDEPYAIEGLKKYIQSIPVLELIATYNDPYAALVDLKNWGKVDLVLLDIDMPKISGIELSKEIRKKTDKLVFTTGHTKYGYEAFQANADGYLLKPYTIGEFILTIDKLFSPKSAKIVPFEPATFLVKNKDDNNKLVTVNHHDVIAVESKLNYVTIYTTQRKVTTYISLTEMIEILTPKNGFFQFHRSFIISYHHIDFIDGNSIKMKNGLVITVREFYRKVFLDFVSKNLLKAKAKKIQK